MAYVLDIAVILIVVLSVCHGWRRGLIRTAVMLVGFILAAFVAAQVAAPVAEGIYDTAVAPRVEAAVVARVAELGEGEITVGLDTLLGDETMFTPYFEGMGWDTAVTVSLGDRSQAAIRKAVLPAIGQVIRPILIYLIEAVTSFVLFIVLLLVVSLLSRLLDAVFKLPVLKQLNQFGGLAVGFLQGVFWALLLTAVLQFAVGCGWLGTTVTLETIEQTELVSKLSNWNWLF